MSFPLWVEIWIDSGRGDYVLLLRDTGVELELIDPQEGGRAVRTFGDYAEATAWLNEDEYDFVEGRWAPFATR